MCWSTVRADTLCWRKTGSVSAHVFQPNCQRASPAVVSERGVDQCAREEPNGPQKQVACDLRAEKALQLCVTQPPMDPMNPSMPFKMARLGTKWELLWADEAERRLAVYREGKLKGIPMEEIFNPLK